MLMRSVHHYVKLSKSVAHEPGLYTVSESWSSGACELATLLAHSRMSQTLWLRAPRLGIIENRRKEDLSSVSKAERLLLVNSNLSTA